MLIRLKSKVFSIQSYFLHMDFIGPQFTFEHNESNRYKTLEGSIISALTIVTLSVVAFLFGKEIYERKYPIVNVSFDNTSYSLIYFNKFPLMFYFSDYEGNVISDFSSIYTPVIRSISMNNAGTVTVKNSTMNIVDCKSKQYDASVKSLVDLELSNRNSTLYCLNWNNDSFFSNSYFSNNSTSFNLGFRLNCRVETEANCLISNNSRILTILYLNTFIDFHNVSNPVSNYIDQINISLMNTVYRRYYFRFRNDIFIYDNGWILEDKVTKQFIKLESTVPDDLKVAWEGEDSYMTFMLSLESPNVNQYTYRNYLKIQDLLAKIGGFANTAIIIMRIITYSYLRFNYVYFIRNEILSHYKKSVKNQTILLKPNQNHINLQIPPLLKDDLNVDSLKMNQEEIPYTSKSARKPGSQSSFKDSHDRKSVGTIRYSSNEYLHVSNGQGANNNEPSEGTMVNEVNGSSEFMKTLKHMSEDIDFGYCDYFLAYFCCKRQKIINYSNQIRSITHVLDFTTFCKSNISNYLDKRV